MCETCGLVYSRAAIAREMALATGAYGLKRLSSGWRSVDDDRGANGKRPSTRGRQP